MSIICSRYAILILIQRNISNDSSLFKLSMFKFEIKLTTNPRLRYDNCSKENIPSI